MINIEDAWEQFLQDGDINNNIIIDENNNKNYSPKVSDIYISTKTIIAYLNTNINLFYIFLKIKIIDYFRCEEGIIKKQMKFNFQNKEELLLIQEKMKNEKNIEEYIINQIDNPDGRVKFKDIRKISIGICNKDVISNRHKKKSAFYNCFVLILRIYYQEKFIEIHIKVFNTGKIEIPGIRSNELFIIVVNKLVDIMKKLLDNNNIRCNIENSETVLINSNFNCGFYINREILVDILKYKYKLNCTYDACQYPGIQCKHFIKKKNISYKISFMIFRTGSILIVGKCDENILNETYNFVKDILLKEYSSICIKNIQIEDKNFIKKKIKKLYLEIN